MANLRALRKKWEADIAALQEKLRALDVVEQGQRDVGRTRTRSQVSRPGTVTDACREAVLGDSTKEWTAADVLKVVQADGAPGATKANVSTALRRLKKHGVLNVVSGNRRTGLTYKVKEGAKE